MHVHRGSQLCNHILVFMLVVIEILRTIADAQTVARLDLTNSNSMNLTLPGYPSQYTNNLDYSFHITVPAGFRIQAKLHVLGLERNKDFLTFGDGTGRELIRLTGKYSPPSILSPANVMWMNFSSDSSSTDVGFKFEVSRFNESGIRLMDGNTPFNGRVEVYTKTYGWGTVSSLGWNFKDASAACKQLGLPGAIGEVANAYYGAGTGVVVMTEVDCTNDNFRLNDCLFRSPCSACPHSQDAGVNCHGPNYVGCYNLPSLQSSFTTVRTADDCISNCDQAKMRYAAINGDRCFCRSSITFSEVPEDDTMCDQTCSGNRNQACGSTQGSSIFTVYDTEFAKCKDPGTPGNATRTGNSLQFGSKIKYNCTDGFDLIGSWEITCEAGLSFQDAVWSSDVPSCIARVINSTEATNTTALPQEQPSESNILRIVTITLAVIFSLIFLIVVICCVCLCVRKGWCKRKPKMMEMWY